MRGDVDIIVGDAGQQSKRVHDRHYSRWLGSVTLFLVSAESMVIAVLS